MTFVDALGRPEDIQRKVIQFGGMLLCSCTRLFSSRSNTGGIFHVEHFQERLRARCCTPGNPPVTIGFLVSEGGGRIHMLNVDLSG
jgi:hypothetical protein